MSDAFLSLDADWHVTYANRECARLNGTTPEALVGQDHWARWPETVGSEVERQYRRAVAEGAPVRFTHHYLEADVWHAVQAYPAEGGGLAVFYRDVTADQRALRERERLYAAERAARAAAERLQVTAAALAGALTPDEVSRVVAEAARAAVGAAAAGVGTVSADGRALEYRAMPGFPETWNHAYDHMPLDAASPLAEAVRTNVAVYLECRADWAARYPALAPVHAAGGYEAAAALPCATAGPGGRVVGGLVLSLCGPHVFGPEERALLVALAQLGATAFARAALYAEAEAARAEAELARRAAEHARERATEANRAKSEFLAMMSHELRTPLNAIAGYAELMELGLRGPLTAAQAADLARIRRANRHLTALVTDTLNLARLEAGRVEFQSAAVELAAVVADVEALVAPQLAAKGLTFDHDGCGPDTPDRPHTVRADPEKLRQVLLNLLTNASKFTRPGGRVALTCQHDRDAGVVRLRVGDTGVGIAPEQLGRVFEPFVQVDRHRTPEGERGVGLGLAISRDLARGMGGDLTAESTPGVGSTFTLTLPAA